MSIILPKDKFIKLAKGLTSKEFRCQCKYESCRSTVVDPKLKKAYGKLRELLNVPFKVNSGYRCPRHNHEVGGKSLSRHTLGEAIDLSRKTINHLSDEDIEFAARECGFNFVLFYKSFVHLDVREL